MANADLNCDEEIDWSQLCQSIVDSADNAANTSTSTPPPQENIRSRGRNWCFTLNNPDQTEIDNLHQLYSSSVGIRYMVFQKEQAATGTIHLQGYVEFSDTMRFNRVKQLISRRAYLARRMGTRQQARQYCMKEDSRIEGPWEYGEWTGGSEFTTTSNPFNQLRTMLEEGKTEEELWDEHLGTMVRYYRGIREFIRIRTPDRDFKTRVIVLYGPPRTGKSKWIMDNYRRVYWKPRGEWWDGYTNQETVALDDFYGWLPYDQLLRLCDRYPLLVPTKGGFTNFVGRTLCFTSNKLPREWYSRVDDLTAFYERVDEWRYVTSDDHVVITDYNNFLRLCDN